MNQPKLFQTEPDPPIADSWPEEERIALWACEDIYGEPVGYHRASIKAYVRSWFCGQKKQLTTDLDAMLDKFIADGYLKGVDELSITDKGLAALKPE